MTAEAPAQSGTIARSEDAADRPWWQAIPTTPWWKIPLCLAAILRDRDRVAIIATAATLILLTSDDRTAIVLQASPIPGWAP